MWLFCFEDVQTAPNTMCKRIMACRWPAPSHYLNQRWYILSIGPLQTNFSENLIEIHIFAFKKMHSKMSAKMTSILSGPQWVDIKAKPHGCCIFSMILHEAPSMETTTPKGEWFPCWVAEWSIMENMQQQMWFCFYPSPISINISIYVYNALRLTPEIWFWAMPFGSFQIDINKYFAIVSPRCRVISNCDVMSP